MNSCTQRRYRGGGRAVSADLGTTPVPCKPATKAGAGTSCLQQGSLVCQSAKPVASQADAALWCALHMQVDSLQRSRRHGEAGGQSKHTQCKRPNTHATPPLAWSTKW